MFDPLSSYHTALRATQSSGYPNMQYLAPHPYEMAWQAQQNQGSPTPFAYNTGRQMRLNNVFAGVDPSRQGIRPPNGYIPPRTQNVGRIAALRAVPGMRNYAPPPQRQAGSGRYDFPGDWQGGLNKAIPPQGQSSRSLRDLSYAYA